MTIKNYKQLVAELVLLAALVGFIPDLIIGGAVDYYGPCGFSDEICRAVEIQGAIKIVGAWICAVSALVIGFLVSKEYRG